jgi:hypothetical protein
MVFDLKRDVFTTDVLRYRAKRAPKIDRAKEREEVRKWRDARERQTWGTRDHEVAAALYDVLDTASEAGVRMSE